jgi:hypothetical protein
VYLGYRYPYYRSPYSYGSIYPYPTPTYGYPSYYGVNAIGSAIAMNSVINTGSMFDVTQIASPTVIL